MSELTWQQKWEALKALGTNTCYVTSRDNGSWYVYIDIEIADGCFLTTPTVSANTPESAIEAMFLRLTAKLTDKEALVVKNGPCERTYLRWNGFMWKKVSL